MGFTVAIVGRPNVGKSTLFNRLVGKRLAIVHDRPGVTRDRRAGAAQLFDLSFTAIDTAGLDEAKGDTLEARMLAQTEQAVAEADVALLLIDARAGPTPLDAHFARRLRSQRNRGRQKAPGGGKKPVLLVANKCEGRIAEASLAECHALGLGEPIAISAEHGLGMAELYEALRAYAPPQPETSGEDMADAGLETAADAAPAIERPLQFAILGRPNVGKSTLANRLIGEERLLTGPEPGITRDAIPVDWEYRGRPLRLVDTAGLRRRAKVSDRLEQLSAAGTMNALRFAELVLLVVDAADPLNKQDLTLADLVIEEGRALVIAMNKWDLVEDRTRTRRLLKDRLEASLAQAKGVAAIPISAATGQGLDKMMGAVFRTYEDWNRHVPTAQLNRFLAGALEAHPPPVAGRARIKLRYMTQPKTRPPTFALFGNKLDALPESYLRYLVNGLREAFDLPGVPIRIGLRQSTNPFAKGAG